MTYKSQEIEIEEAISAANLALNHLYKSEKYMSSAQNWGLIDIIGGGWLVTFIKRNKMRDAQDEVREASIALRNLSSELNDVKDFSSYIQTEDEGFIEFADYFFDGAIADVYVQTRISSALSKIRDTIDKVERIKASLETM